MAASAFHTRSKSLPSRPHPLTSLLDEQLSRLRTSKSASASTSLNQKLNSLQDLHDSVQKLLQLPSTRQSLNEENVDELLDGSLVLLDLCNSAKDALLQTRESIQEIQSILRRRRGSEMKLAKEIKKYLSFKKARRKANMKSLKNLKHKGNKHSLLREVEAVSLNVLESLLSLIAGAELERMKSHLSLVSKLLHNKRVGCEEEQGLNKISTSEATLLSFMKGKSDRVQIENVQVKLQKSNLASKVLKKGLTVSLGI